MDVVVLVAGVVVYWFLAGAVVFVWFQRGAVARYWREPMVVAPVLVIESDDWGPGFEGQTIALARLRNLLRSYRDSQGQPVVMTLGVLLAAPDRRAMRQEGCQVYRCVTLAESRYEGLCEEMRAGEAEGVFSLQLHGHEHFWPPALMVRAQVDETVGRWLVDPGEAEIYALPSYLQSRWVDTSTLPTSPLPSSEAMRAVQAEVALYRDLFGAAPRVVVPPTFVWTEEVEQIWAGLGVEVVVTPGTRYPARDQDGGLVSDGSILCNAEHLCNGMVAAVRNGYYEPRLGHDMEEALRSFEGNVRCGRPTLLESHGFNYVGENGEAGLDGLAHLLEPLEERYPGIRFVSTLELMREFKEKRGNRQVPLRYRLSVVAARLLAVWSLHRWRLLTGAGLWLRFVAARWRMPGGAEDHSR